MGRVKNGAIDLKRYEQQALVYEQDAEGAISRGKLNPEIPTLYEHAARKWKKAEHPLRAWADYVAAERVYQDLSQQYKNKAQLVAVDCSVKALNAKKQAHEIGQEMHAAWFFDIMVNFIKIPRPVRLTTSIISICVGFLLMSWTITGNAIANSLVTSSSIIGAMIIIIGIVLAYFGLNKRFNRF